MAGRKILAIGAHPDDVELGCGGTLLRHIGAGDQVTMLVVTQGEVGPGATGRRLEEQAAAAELMGVSEVIWGGLPDCCVSNYELDLVHLIERAMETSACDVIYTHSLEDSHQDHRAVALGTAGAARLASNVLCYDAPSSMRGFAPSVYVDITETVEKKIEVLMCHGSQVEASEMVSAREVRNTAGYRGHEARVAYAEAFEPIRFVVDI